jgi:hypothetical protein
MCFVVNTYCFKINTYHLATIPSIWICGNYYNHFFVFFFQELEVMCGGLCSTIFVEHKNHILLLFIGIIVLVFETRLGFGFYATIFVSNLICNWLSKLVWEYIICNMS